MTQCWPAGQQIPSQQLSPIALLQQTDPLEPQQGCTKIEPGQQIAPLGPRQPVSVVSQQAPLVQWAKMLQHAPPQQRWSARQARVQLPQWFGSLFVSTQPPKQKVWPAGQVT